MAIVVNNFKDIATDLGSYANYMVFLCASAVNIISNQRASSSNHRGNDNNPEDLYAMRWKALFDLIEDWYTGRPDGMLPLLKYSTATAQPENPFPLIIYGSPPASMLYSITPT